MPYPDNYVRPHDLSEEELYMDELTELRHEAGSEAFNQSERLSLLLDRYHDDWDCDLQALRDVAGRVGKLADEVEALLGKPRQTPSALSW